ncbi:uncharacterized protein [Leptinotarsa decemlineata]|uniref:uncharacterized protein n=1 Tax=Leptinotarsa decemlineata TaxID=7539 RepID=UPI003D30A66D
MDFELAGPSNGVGPPRKKMKHSAPRDSSRRDLASFPKDVLLKIFGYLDLQSINNCAMLCSTFYNLSKESSLYTSVTLKYNMSPHFLESLIAKVSCPKAVSIKYKPLDQHAEKENLLIFEKYVEILLRKCGEHLLSLKIEGCRSDKVLLNLKDCICLKRLTLYRCKSSFDVLAFLCHLTSISFTSCHFPQKVVSELIRANPNLKYLFLSNNINVNANEICEIMSKQNPEMMEVYFNERKKVRAKSLRTLARLTNLRKLVLKSSSGFECDPEDALELLAAGCSRLEKLSIHGWKEINDDNFIPALRMFTQLKTLDMRGTSITIKSCRDAALTLPLLETIDVIECNRIKRQQLISLRHDFEDINIPLD